MDTLNNIVQKPLAGMPEAVPALSKARQLTQAGQLPSNTANKPLRDAETEEPKMLDAEKLRELVDQANQTMAAQNRRLMFSVDDKTGIKLVQVFDMDTDKLVRQFPPDEYIGVVEQIQGMMPEETRGFMLKEQA